MTPNELADLLWREFHNPDGCMRQMQISNDRTVIIELRDPIKPPKPREVWVSSESLNRSFGFFSTQGGMTAFPRRPNGERYTKFREVLDD